MRLLPLRLLGLLLSAVVALTLACATPSGAATERHPGARVATTADADTTPSLRGGRTECVRGSTSSSGTCYQFLRSTKNVVPVEAVPVRNRSSRSAKFTCGFTRSVSRSVEWGGSVTSKAEVSAVFGLAKLSVAATISKKETQSAEQASSVQGKFTLRPGEEATCVRTYGSVVMKVRKYSYSGHRTVSDQTFRTRLPSYLGVDLID